MQELQQHQIACNFYTQANFFLQSSICVSKYCRKQMQDNPHAFYSQMEGIIVGTHHAFAIELLIKGILRHDHNVNIRGHDLSSLLGHEKTTPLRDALGAKYVAANNGQRSSDDFLDRLKSHAAHFAKYRYACDSTPPPLDMEFTSFLCEELRIELANRLTQSGLLSA